MQQSHCDSRYAKFVVFTERFSHYNTDLETHSASGTKGTGSFPGIRRPERGADHPPLPSGVLRMGKSYTSASPLRLPSHVVVDPYLYL